MSQLGRISGPLLKANLLREGVDLAFETDLLYLDVSNMRIGVNTSTPTHALQVNGTTRTVNLETDELNIGDITISGNSITSNTGILNLSGFSGSAIQYQNKLKIDAVTIDGNVISTNTTDTNLELRPDGTGTVEVFSDLNVAGNIHATGTITADGDITIGNSDVDDNIIFNADIASNILPNTTDFYDLGTSLKRWDNVWAKTIHTNLVAVTGITVDGVALDTRPGKMYYVATNGRDTYSGTHQNDPFASISHACTEASVGDTIFVYPGDYTEPFPIEVPPGVTVRGESLRAVTVRPTMATRFNDAFHMNGEATVEDLTITGFNHAPTNTYFEYGADGNGTGHAFRFSNNTLTATRSPYIRNITVITFGTPSVLSIDSVKTEVVATITHIKSIISTIVTNGTFVKTTGNPLTQNKTLTASDGTTGTLLQGLLDNVLTVINNGTQFTSLPTLVANGTPAVVGMLYNAAEILSANKEFIKEEANAYTQLTYPGVCDPVKTKRDMGYIVDALIVDIVGGGNNDSVQVGWDFWQQPVDDPRGYSRGDAGHGALIDGRCVNTESKEAAMLFHSVTFITPAAETLIAKNGARVEWLNSFTYFAEKGMYLTSGDLGFAGVGKTEIRLTGTTGTFNVGDVVTYYSTYPTVLASGTIVKKDTDGKLYLSGKVAGLQTSADRGGKTITANGDAKLSQSVKKWGSASLALDGTGDEAYVAPSPDFNFGSNNFTLECWVYPTAVPTAGSYAFVMGQSKAGAGNTSCGLYLGSAGGIIYLYSFGTFGTVAGAPVAINAWSHIALTREGNSFKLWVNGTQAGATVTYSGAMTSANGTNFTIGGNAGYNLYFTGYIDDLRVSKGVARYTGTFTAPTSILANDSYTSLLSRFDGANNSTTFVDETILIQDVRSNTGASATGISLVDYSDFGAEVRSIGSACVYGNYGIYGTGLGVTAYLIGQNLAYIGVGKRSDNDVTYVIQDNEVVESDGAKIYYSSVDHRGDFRIGNLFYVNQEAGTVQFTTSSFNIQSDTGVTFTSGGSTTYVDGTKLETGDLRLSGNTLESLTGPLNIVGGNDQINFANNVTIAGNLDVTGNVTISGNIQVGNQTTDTINFVAEINSNLVPSVTGTYSLGTNSLQWASLYTDEINVGSVNISQNIVTTTGTNTDLVLKANGTGKITVPTSDVEITNNLTVNGITNLSDVNVTGLITHTGDYTQTGDTEITGNLTTTGYGQFGNIKIDGNTISNVVTDNDIILEPTGTGVVKFENFEVLDNKITNTVSNSITTIEQTGTGYFKLADTGGFVVPVGNEGQRPLVPVTGMTRYNTDISRLEVYNGSQWQFVIATADNSLTRDEAEDIALTLAIILG